MDTTNIINILSRRLVWEKPIPLNKAASIHESILGKASIMKRTSMIRGIGYSLYKEKQYIDFFIPQDYDINIIKNIARRIKINYRTFRTNEFISYAKYPASTSIPTVLSGNAVKHYRLNGYGTLGGYVNDLVTDYRLAISNNHVIGLNNQATLDDKILYYYNSSGTIDLGGFYRSVQLLKPPNLNQVDVAVSWILDDRKLKWAWKKPSSSAKPRIGMEVYKIGATSDYTEGTIKGFTNLRVDYKGTLGHLNFSKSLRIVGKGGVPFSEPGDSGSLVFNKKNHKVVGLAFAGDDSGIYSFANNFLEVENKLNIII